VSALRIEVTRKDQNELKTLLSGGVQQVRVSWRAVALLQLGKGRQRAAYFGGCSAHATGDSEGRAIATIEGGLERALYEKERPGAAAFTGG